MGAVSPAEFEALVAHHRREVLAVCRSVLRDEHLGADAAQEAFVRLWRRMQGEGTPAEPRGWLRKAALSSAIDELRRRPRAGALDEDEAREPVAVQAPQADAELAVRFERALAGLSEGQRTVFLLRHEGGLRLTEIAATLGVSRETVRTQFARAVLKLQSRLARHRPDEDEA